MTKGEQEPLDMQEQLKLKLWSGEYYHKGYPIVRLLADLAISAIRREQTDD